MKKFEIAICILVPVIIIFRLWMPAFIGIGNLFGFYTGGFGDDVSEKIIEQGLDSSECEKIVGVPWFTNTSAIEQKSMCYMELAETKIDPILCMLIEHGYYKKACLGYVQQKMEKRKCMQFMYEEGVHCQGELASETAQIENCSVYQTTDLRDWCYTERSRTIDHVNDCQKVTDNPPELRWECEMYVAIKEKDPIMCDSIPDENWVNLCRGWIETLAEEEIVKLRNNE